MCSEQVFASIYFRVDDGRDFSLDTDFRVMISSRGQIQWIPSFRWRTTCSIDLSLFPFDTQICTVRFISWLHALTSEIEFHLDSRVRKSLLNETQPILDGLLSENNHWDLEGSHLSFLTSEIDVGQGIPGKFSSVSFTLALRRKSLYYNLNILMPCMIVSLMSIFMFYLPIQSGEKASFGITVLLSYTLLLVMVNDITPRGGTKVPMLCKYVN